MKIFITALTLLFSLACSATPINVPLQNQEAASSTLYVYPSLAQSAHVNDYFKAQGCSNPSAPYYSCAIPAQALTSLAVNDLPHFNTRIFCVSKNAPSGDFQDCAPDACQFSVNGTQIHQDGGNCAGISLSDSLQNAASSGQNAPEIVVKTP